MKENLMLLVAEFSGSGRAHDAAKSLYEAGLDAGDVSVHDESWMGGVDSHGAFRPTRAAFLGAKVSVPLSFLGAMLIVGGLANRPGGDFSTAKLLAVFLAIIAVGFTIGFVLGWIYGLIALAADTPSWIARKYGPALRSGSYLVCLYGDSSAIDIARNQLSHFAPSRLELHPLTRWEAWPLAGNRD